MPLLLRLTRSDLEQVAKLFAKPEPQHDVASI